MGVTVLRARLGEYCASRLFHAFPADVQLYYNQVTYAYDSDYFDAYAYYSAALASFCLLAGVTIVALNVVTAVLMYRHRTQVSLS